MLLTEHAIKWWFVIPPFLTNVSALPGETLTWTPKIVFSVMLYTVSRKQHSFGLQYLWHLSTNFNKSAQSNLGRGPRCGAVAHVRPIGPFGQWRAPNSPQKYPFLWTDHQTPPPASSLDPSDLWCQTASGSDEPFFHNALDRQTDRPTDRPRRKFDD